jgi:tetratricopeptide (TPR) repeat protein
MQVKRLQPVLDDPDLQINDPEIINFEQKTASSLDQFMNGSRIKSPVIMATLHEADNARKSPSVKTLELYTAIEEYNKVIELRKEAGPVEAPDLIMARAYVGLYDCELQLRQYNKLAVLEKEILKYCPKGLLANEAYVYIQNAANVNVKRKKTMEALRCLEASSELLKLNDFKDGAQMASLELNIGTTYLSLNIFDKAKLWLDRSRMHLEKVGASDVTYMACLIRSGVACRALKDYKGAVKYFRAAEKVAPSLTKEGEEIYWGHMYYQWAVTLIEMRKYDEAQSKIQKGLALGDRRSSKGLNRLLEAIRKENQSNRQKVAN